jgi:hypothetical protein
MALTLFDPSGDGSCKMELIGDHNFQDYQQDRVVGGERKSRGGKPRNYQTHPIGVYGAKEQLGLDIPLIPTSEYDDRIADIDGSKSSLIDMRNTGNGGQHIPSRDQTGRGYCFPTGTKVRLANGAHKPIDKMSLLDVVLTAEGNLGTVRQLHVREYDGDIVRIKAWGHSHLRLTPNHQVLTRRGYVAAGELTKDDYVAIPKFAPQSSAVIQTRSHIVGVKRRVKNVSGSAQFEYRIPSSSDSGTNHLPDFIDLNYSTGRIFGLWLAEGHIDDSTGSKHVVWSFGTAEKVDLIEELVTLLKTEWGLDAKIKQGHSPTVTCVSVGGAMWCQLFESLCGRRAGGKVLHGDMMSGPKDFLKGVFTGHRDADGERTVSPNLAANLFDIANFLGLRPGVLREAPQNNEFCMNRLAVWRLSLNSNTGKNQSCGYDYRVQDDSNYMWRRVRYVKREKFVGNVYNIGVEGDNSYVAESIGVHNCWAHSGVSAHLCLRARENQPYADLSAYAVACVIKHFADEGGWGAQGLDFQVERGCPTAKFWPQQGTSRSYDNAETWADAAKHKIIEGWYDLNQAQYDRNLTWNQVCTCLLSRIPVVVDYNWWSHSVCAVKLIKASSMWKRSRAENGKLLSLKAFDVAWATYDPVTGGYAVIIWNSWGDSWSDAGMGALSGSKSVPDGSVAPRVAGIAA